MAGKVFRTATVLFSSCTTRWSLVLIFCSLFYPFFSAFLPLLVKIMWRVQNTFPIFLSPPILASFYLTSFTLSSLSFSFCQLSSHPPVLSLTYKLPTNFAKTHRSLFWILVQITKFLTCRAEFWRNVYKMMLREYFHVMGWCSHKTWSLEFEHLNTSV